MKKTWFYVIWPPIVLNLGAVLVIAGLYASRYATTPSPAPGSIQIGYGQMQFALSVLIFIVEWIFAAWLLISYRKSGVSIRSLFSRSGRLLDFRWAPAVLLFVAFNAIFAAYMFYLVARMPDLSYRDMNLFQAGFLLLLTPLTAGFTEELIWRGHIISGFEQGGKKPWAALLISAASFALIHGVFLPDKLAVTFLIGIVAGAYYQRERSLLPLMVTHWFVDVWSFGLFFLR